MLTVQKPYGKTDAVDSRESRSTSGGECSVNGIGVRAFASVENAVSEIIGQDKTVKPGFAVAINPEKIIRARRDRDIRSVLESGTLCYPDGIGVVLTMRKKGIPTRRIPGIDLWEALMKRAAVAELPVFLLGARASVIEKVVTRLKEELGTPLAGYHSGYFDDDARMIETIATAGPAIVAVGMGSPRQEQFILQCRKRWPKAFYMGVGGSFDVYAGAVLRAPMLFRKAGAEWMYRLLRQPLRIRRQRALLIYAALHLSGRL